jgi:hypothetical protein
MNDTVLDSYVEQFESTVSARYIFINHQGLFGISSHRELSMSGTVKYVNRHSDDVRQVINDFIINHESPNNRPN